MGKGYYAYVVGGLITVVAVTLVLGLTSENQTGEGALPFILGTVVVFVLGLLILQWRITTKRSAAQTADPPPGTTPGAGTDDAGRIDAYPELMALIATEDYDEERLRRGLKASRGMVTSHLKLSWVLVPLCLAAGILGAYGKLPNFGAWEFWPLVPFALAPLALGWVYLMMGRAKDASADLLSPLGLELTDMPSVGVRPRFGGGMQSDVSGATVMKGTRHGRAVEVVMDARRHTTLVGAPAPEFELEVKSGVPAVKSGSAAGLDDALAGLAPSDRWKKLRSVKGGPDGVVAERKVDAENGWLWDLWLCERLAERLR